MKSVQTGIYRHTKTGNLYRVTGVAKHSETLEDMVIYECLYDNPKSKVWVRPATMFTETIQHNGTTAPRFEYIENKT